LASLAPLSLSTYFNDDFEHIRRLIARRYQIQTHDDLGSHCLSRRGHANRPHAGQHLHFAQPSVSSSVTQSS
jgi:hypothetical protein